MRKPNTSRYGYEAPSVQTTYHGSQLAHCCLLIAVREWCVGGPSRRTVATGLPHLKISNSG